MVASPSPVHDTPPKVLSAYVPAADERVCRPPARGAGRRDLRWTCPATIVPKRSMATAPTVPRLNPASSRRRWRSVIKLGGIAQRDAERAGPTSIRARRQRRRRWPPSSRMRRASVIGFPDLGHARDGAVFQCGSPSMIEASISTVPVGGQDEAAPCIEARVVLENSHRRFHRIERAAPSLEDVPAGRDGALDALAQLLGTLRRVCSRAAVHDERRDAACHRITPRPYHDAVIVDQVGAASNVNWRRSPVASCGAGSVLASSRHREAVAADPPKRYRGRALPGAAAPRLRRPGRARRRDGAWRPPRTAAIGLVGMFTG